MKRLTTLAFALLSLNSFASLEIPGNAQNIAIDSVRLTKVATAWRSIECTEYNSQAVDCTEPTAFKTMVQVYVGYTDDSLSIEDKDQFVNEMFETSEFSSSELQTIRKGNKGLFKLAIQNDSELRESDICNDEYGCINGENIVHSSYNASVKIINILKK